MHIVTAVTPILVPPLWPLVKDHLASAISESNDETTEEIVYNELVNGVTMLLIAYNDTVVDGAAILRTKEFDTKSKCLLVHLLGGRNMDQWLDDGFKVIKLVAQDYKCDKIYCIGRLGWEKVLGKFGFEKAYSVLSTKVEV